MIKNSAVIKNSVVPLQRAQVRFVVRELRSHLLQCGQKGHLPMDFFFFQHQATLFLFSDNICKWLKNIGSNNPEALQSTCVCDKLEITKMSISRERTIINCL